MQAKAVFNLSTVSQSQSHLLNIPFEKFTFSNTFTSLCQRYINYIARGNVKSRLSRKPISLYIREIVLQIGNSIHTKSILNVNNYAVRSLIKGEETHIYRRISFSSRGRVSR